MSIDVIIVTKNREDIIEHTIDSIINQTFSPTSIIIIDDSTNDITHKICEEYHLSYYKNEFESSITGARNFAITKSTSDILLFVDDDVILDSNYIKILYEYFKLHPHIMGITGNDINLWLKKLPRYVNVLCKMFGLPYMKKNINCITNYFTIVYPYPFTHDITAQWLAGNNFAIRNNVCKYVMFDTHLHGYAMHEDIDISLQINRLWPNSLMALHNCMVTHNSMSHMKYLKRYLMLMKNEWYIVKKHQLMNFQFILSRFNITLAYMVLISVGKYVNMFCNYCYKK